MYIPVWMVPTGTACQQVHWHTKPGFFPALSPCCLALYATPLKPALPCVAPLHILIPSLRGWINLAAQSCRTTWSPFYTCPIAVCDGWPCLSSVPDPVSFVEHRSISILPSHALQKTSSHNSVSVEEAISLWWPLFYEHLSLVVSQHSVLSSLCPTEALFDYLLKFTKPVKPSLIWPYFATIMGSLSDGLQPSTSSGSDHLSAAFTVIFSHWPVGLGQWVRAG